MSEPALHNPVTPPAVRRDDLSLEAADGFRLAAELHRPSEGPLRSVALMAPAMGVPRTFYRPFAAYLAQAGVAVLSLDYRGVGGSKRERLRGFHASLTDWADLDLAAGIACLRRAFPGRSLTWMGHSVGGQLLGLAHSPDVDRAVLIGAQSGYWRNWSGVHRWLVAGVWYVAMPAAIALTGKVPMRAFRQGENLPAEIGRQWARAGKHPRYLASDAKAGSGFETFRGPLRAYGLSDDGYAPAKAIRALVREFGQVTPDVRIRTPTDLGVKRVGHFGVFRQQMGQKLWDEIRAWLAPGEGAALSE